MRNPATSLPDTRQVVVTNHSVVIDGRDISHLVTAVDINVQAGSWLPQVVITAAPDHILYSGSAVVPEVPLDGIERLRKRLGI